MSDYRININELVDREEIDKGTAAEFIAINSRNGRKGVYKIDGAMMFSDHEDLREKLASDILNAVGKKSAEIELTYDAETDTKGCFSYYIINDDEKLVSGEDKTPKDGSHNISDYVNAYVDEIRDFEGITEENIEQRRKHVIETIYMDCILDNGDRKSDNMEMIYNNKTGKYYNAPTYDYGTAFTTTQNGNGPFRDMKKEEVLKQLFDKYGDYIKDLAETVNSKITKKYLKNELSKECYKDGLNKNTRDKIVQSVITNVKLSKRLCKEKEINGSFISRFLNRFKSKNTDKLPSVKNDLYKTNDNFLLNLENSVYPPNENDIVSKEETNEEITKTKGETEITYEQ